MKPTRYERKLGQRGQAIINRRGCRMVPRTSSKLGGADTAGAIFCNTVMPDGRVRNATLGPCPGA